ncbi:diguanylate cyclase [Rhodoferax sp. PAMC 29310]|uniref:sensor domain-containing diguanylate cyclase n=1 Tax=Rhodoferax sp. PAMC 29310 TaxID=2822760 RepID=UPI001B31D3F0|nr:diguanylate cyclase [Rhodoferax sp. PAMC 29310]
MKTSIALINKLLRGWVFFWAAGLMSFGLFAQSMASDTFPGFTLSEAGPARIDVATRMGVLIDPDRTMTPDQVTRSQTGWQTINRTAPNFGFTSDAYWFRFDLQNTSVRPVNRLVEVPIPFLDEVRLYHLVDGMLTTTYALGDAQPFALRPVRHPHFVMPLKLLPGSNQIYLRLASTGTIEASVRVWEPLAFQVASQDESLLQGGFAGVLLIMVIYNLFLFFSIRDLSYIYFIGFVSSYLLFHLSLSGYAFAYLWPDAVTWNSYAISTFAASSALFTCLFANSFLKLRHASVAAFLLLNALAVISALLTVSTFFLPYSVTIRIGASLAIPVALIALLLGYWLWWRGAKFARFYCLAWTAVLIGLLVLAAEKFGLVPNGFWSNNAPQIGILVQVVLLSITLADRINADRSLRLEAQSEALDIERAARASQTALIAAQEHANVELEKRVQARTNDLNQTLEKLQIANTRLQHLSTTDGLTQISNRAFFDQSLQTEHRRAARLGTSLSVILFDIDHFKKINDSYGHPAGDECLRAVGEVLRSKMLRAEDVVARYGGEEFVLLRVNASLTNSIAVAEELRVEIENLRLDINGHPIQFTASFGVAIDMPTGNSSPQDLVSEADKALYQAKSDGRNRVQVAAT